MIVCSKGVIGLSIVLFFLYFLREMFFLVVLKMACLSWFQVWSRDNWSWMVSIDGNHWVVKLSISSMIFCYCSVFVCVQSYLRLGFFSLFCGDCSRCHVFKVVVVGL
jgi:hypothetical protein